MTNLPHGFDWNQARAFLATAETGTLSAAARQLGLTQPTLSRQVAALEETLGVLLFDRVGRSLAITPVGLDLLDQFRAMGQAADRIALAASGQSQEIEGLVTVTTSDSFAAYVLPSVLRRLRQIAPLVDIEIIASNEVRDLTRREADIAIRHLRPEQPDLVARLVRTDTARLYAAPAYMEMIGRPETPDDLARAEFIGFAPVDRLILSLNSLGLSLTRRQFRLVTDNGVVAGELIRQGFGIGAMPQGFARILGVTDVLPGLPGLPVPFWLVTHRELHTSRRIRLVFDLLAEALAEPVAPGPSPI